jgi:hypothetical protein
MTSEEIRIAISGTLSASWATASDIAWPNHSFDPPRGPWIRPVVKMGDTYIGELGDGIGVRTGVLMISVYDVPNHGEITARTLADRLETMFRRADLSGVHFDEPSTDTLGIDESNYFALVVKIPFTTWIGEI